MPLPWADKAIANLPRGASHPNWKGDATNSPHSRAEKLFPIAGRECEEPDCTKPAVDRHHIDGNPWNNVLSNIAFLCRRHHMERDGRIPASNLIERHCSDCAARITKGSKTGRCQPCAVRRANQARIGPLNPRWKGSLT